MQIESFWQGQHITSFFPQDIEIMGWCPTGPVLPHQGESASLALIGYPSSAGVTIEILYGVGVYYIDQPHTPSFPIELFKSESDFVRTFDTGLGR